MEFVLPVRGLIGYRGQLLTDTRGTALLHQIGEGYGPWAGEVTHRTNGVLVARPRRARRNAYGLFNLQERAELFIGAGVEVYEGMIVGENSRLGRHGRQPDQGEEAHQHPDPRPRRVAAADAAAAAHARDRRIEFIAGDELVEVTPASIRLRKRLLSQHDRRREAGREYERRAERGLSASHPIVRLLTASAPGRTVVEGSSG